MKTLNLKRIILSTLVILGFGVANAQLLPRFDNWRPPSKEGINTFEAPKTDTIAFDGLKLRVGGDFAIQFQAIDQLSSQEGELTELRQDFNLPTANLNLNLLLADGMQLYLRTYLSSRNHSEAWVKGGFLQIDNLDFIQPGLASGLMENIRIRVGMDDINYGDAHFRRSDNARALYNPFVGNYLMDAFTTEPFFEVNFLPDNGIIGVLGASNGQLNQRIASAGDYSPTIYGKLGYDNRATEGLRFRLTGSFYVNGSESGGRYLYSGDRAGSRYYGVLSTNNPDDRESNFSGRFSPGFAQISSFQFNPFIKYEGLEFFGILEFANSTEDAGVDATSDGGSFTQVAGEVLYRFGASEQFYVGGRYNDVSGQFQENADEVSVNRLNFGGGWFLTPNVLTKFEVVNQEYSNMQNNATFDGFVVEAVISF